mmetsp:Transcript_116183/g.200674  ORF Transcript_116183/g.200674 Transcript_116183/m.200674 type:complete len:309 (-) Transcript_116183:685-1611(-)
MVFEELDGLIGRVQGLLRLAIHDMTVGGCHKSVGSNMLLLYCKLVFVVCAHLSILVSSRIHVCNLENEIRSTISSTNLLQDCLGLLGRLQGLRVLLGLEIYMGRRLQQHDLPALLTDILAELHSLPTSHLCLVNLVVRKKRVDEVLQALHLLALGAPCLHCFYAVLDRAHSAVHRVLRDVAFCLQTKSGRLPSFTISCVFEHLIGLCCCLQCFVCEVHVQGRFGDCVLHACIQRSDACLLFHVVVDVANRFQCLVDILAGDLRGSEGEPSLCFTFLVLCIFERVHSLFSSFSCSFHVQPLTPNLGDAK